MPSAAQPAHIEYERAGLRLGGTPLWFDARKPRELSFVSSARAAVAPHARLICTDATQRLLRLQDVGSLSLTPPYRRPFSLGALSLELFPAGHILGSAQMRVAHEGRTVVYTGALSLERNGLGEPAEIAGCDTLVLEATYGHPRYVLPPRAETLAKLDKFVDDALSDGVTPVLLALSLGTAQELFVHLGKRGHVLRAHRSAIDIARVYESCGTKMPRLKLFRGPVARGDVVIFPPHLSRSRALEALPRRRTCLLSGWVMDAGVPAAHSVDCGLPLSGHADFPQLVRVAKESGAARVYTVHGYAVELARALTALGLDARPLQPAGQLDLFA